MTKYNHSDDEKLLIEERYLTKEEEWKITPSAYDLDWVYGLDWGDKNN